MSEKKIHVIEVFFWLMLIIYGATIVINANFGVIDDHGLLDSLLAGKEMPLFIRPEIGRFFPLDGFEYNLISKISINPKVFYIYNSLQFFLINFILYKILIGITGKSYRHIIFIVNLLLVFTPGFTSAWLRLLIPERSELVFFVLFLYFFLKYQNKQKVAYLLGGLISANIALYYKEPAFLMLGSFAFFHQVLGWKKLNFMQRIFNYLLMASATMFIVVYYFVVYIHKGETLYGQTTLNPILQFIKNVFNYALSDPLIVFILIPLAGWRMYEILKLKRINHLFDALVFSSSIYVFAFLKLNMFAHHYLLPVYGFGLVAIVYYLLEEQYFKKVIVKTFCIIVGFLVIFSSLPTGLHFMSHYKNVPNNFQNTLLFLNKYISSEVDKKTRINIYFDGVNRAAGEEVQVSFIKYMEYGGLNSGQFNIGSDENIFGVQQFIVNPDNPHSFFNQTAPTSLESGDLIVVTPYTSKYIGLDKKEIKEMEIDWELLYHTKSFLEIPNIGIKSIIKDIYRKKRSNRNDRIVVSENIYQLPLDFYVFKKR